MKKPTPKPDRRVKSKSAIPIMALDRRVRYQLEHRKLGLCLLCSEKAIGNLCARHMVKRREYQRKYVGSKRRNDCLSRRMEKE